MSAIIKDRSASTVLKLNSSRDPKNTVHHLCVLRCLIRTKFPRLLLAIRIQYQLNRSCLAPYQYISIPQYRQCVLPGGTMLTKPEAWSHKALHVRCEEPLAFSLIPSYAVIISLKDRGHSEITARYPIIARP